MRDNRINGALNVSRTIGDLDFKRNAELPHTEQMVRTASQTAAEHLEQLGSGPRQPASRPHGSRPPCPIGEVNP